MDEAAAQWQQYAREQPETLTEHANAVASLVREGSNAEVVAFADAFVKGDAAARAAAVAGKTRTMSLEEPVAAAHR